jgi:4-hydroxybenzoate polyprenyltransferase
MSALARVTGKTRLLLDFVKFEHTVFALPFALMAAFVAADGAPAARTLLWILGAMVGARSSAMAFNRLADRDLDERNPRTDRRALPAGLLTAVEAWALTAAGAGLFVLSAAMLNRLALALSPVALAIVWGYSYSKRYTLWSHLLLGLCLGIAPVGAWIAVRGGLAWSPLLLAAAVMLWTGGFDIIYACQDIDFDRRERLFSLPARWGAAHALQASSALHAVMLGLLVWWGVAVGMGALYFGGLVVVAALLVHEHRLVKPNDLRSVNAAFFTANGFVSIGLLLFTLGDLFARWR